MKRKKFPQLNYFKPRNPQKYKGNPNNIVSRSSWETKFMLWADRNNNVLWWSSEEISIPYWSPLDNKIHKYFPDFLMAVKDKDNNIKVFLIEVKPKKQTLPPKPRKKMSKQYIYEINTYGINKEKWKSAKEYCEKRDWNFKIITEEELF
jgi:hypothetical protein